MPDPIAKLVLELKIRGRSPRTIHAYTFYLKRFLRFVGDDVKEVKTEHFRAFFEDLVTSGVSGSTYNVALAALRFYSQNIIGRRLSTKRFPSPELLTYPLEPASFLGLRSRRCGPKTVRFFPGANA